MVCGCVACIIGARDAGVVLFVYIVFGVATFHQPLRFFKGVISHLCFEKEFFLSL